MDSRQVFEHFNDPRVSTGGYYIEENGRIGGGGQGEVYAAGRKGSDDALAIKILQDDPANPRATQLFQAEAAIMSELGDHPNIVTVHYSGMIQNRTKEERRRGANKTRYWYTVMDRGIGTLATEIQAAGATEQGRLPAPVATQYILDMVAAVGHAHGERHQGERQPGRLHCDLKPANVLLFPTSEPERPLEARLTDFGIARRGYHTPGDITETHLGAGTFLYADPRQFYEGGALYAHDQYGTATTAWHVLTGRALFGEYTDLQQLQHAHLFCEPPVAELMRAGRIDRVAEAVQMSLLKALHKDPSQRYPTMMDFGDSVLEAMMRGAELDARQRTIHPLGPLLGWRVPSGLPEQRAYRADVHMRYDLAVPSTGLSRRALLAAGALVAGSAAGAGLWWANRDAAPGSTPETPAMSYEKLLQEAFAADPPKLPELSAAEKSATRESIKAVNAVVVKYLKQQANMSGGDMGSMQRFIAALTTYDARQAYDLWKWLEPLGSLSSDAASKADVQAWAAAALARVKPDEMSHVLVSADWKDGGLDNGSYTDVDTTRACNRAVLGCALAQDHPGAVRTVVDTYSGNDSIAAGFNSALKLALNPKGSHVERDLDLLGFEQSAAVAATLARANPTALVKDMTVRRSNWELSPPLFGRALIPLIETRPDYVASVVRGKSLDSTATPFDQSVTLEVGLRCAPKYPETAQDLLQQRLGDVPKSAEAMLAMALTGYKPAIGQAVLIDQPHNTLLKLALDPTNETLRARATAELETVFAREAKDQLGEQPTLRRAALLAMAFLGGQQRRLAQT